MNVRQMDLNLKPSVYVLQHFSAFRAVLLDCCTLNSQTENSFENFAFVYFDKNERSIAALSTGYLLSYSCPLEIANCDFCQR